MKCSLLIFICICFFIRINKSITLADDHIKSYCPEGRYLWDSWVLEDNIDGEKIYRLYHLDAVDNGNPESRHDIASVRQAISKDLVNWKDLGPTFLPGPAGSWDDGPIWTGNVYKKNDGTYLFFYTARNHRDGQFQRIGLARSENGVTWERSDKPLVVPDGTWYETMEISPVYRAWRDPFVIKDEKSGKYLMYITAKTKYGHDIYKGCIALAVADEIEGPYEVKQPVLAPGLYAQMEVPQIIEKEGKVYIFFSCQEKDYSPEWAEKTGGAETGLHCFISDSLYGPFEPLNGTGIVTTSKDNLYTVKLIEDPQQEGTFIAIGWYMESKNGQEALTLSKPMEVLWEQDIIKIKTD